ncbi:MAG: glutamate 5-kinase [Firmicutes bacterium]|nr:glutamate 5-kinase [Bacillota bacterium]
MRIVIKIGTSTLAYEGGRMNIRRVETLCKVISDIKNSGHKIILVSSGAIGMGVGKLSMNTFPEDIPSKQAAAAVGQCELMYVYDKLFTEYNHTVAQILLTGSDFSYQDRRKNFENTLEKLLELNVLPVINENDSVATKEIKVGDNDTLAAMVAKSSNSDLLVLMSDIDGLYTEDPHKSKNAKLIKVVDSLNDDIMALGGGKGSVFGTGGMKTKLQAAKICTESGCDMVILNGKDPEILYDYLEGKQVGTFFKSNKEE